jgi:hypothetical protein
MVLVSTNVTRPASRPSASRMSASPSRVLVTMQRSPAARPSLTNATDRATYSSSEVWTNA